MQDCLETVDEASSLVAHRPVRVVLGTAEHQGLVGVAMNVGSQCPVGVASVSASAVECAHLDAHRYGSGDEAVPVSVVVQHGTVPASTVY